AASRGSWEMQRFEDGLSDITPAVESWALCALRMAAYHLAKLDRKDEAKQLAERIVSRYASATAMSDAAFVYWTEGDLEAAARVLAHRNATLTSEDVRFKVGPLFADAFQRRPGDAQAAVNALHAAQVEPWYALDLGVALENRGAYEGAFKVATAFEVPPNGPRQMQMLHAASALQKWRGEQAAREWLTGQIGKPVEPRAAYDLAMIAYRAERDARMFALPEPQGDPGTVESVWLFRAAALKRLGNKADAKARAAVNAHYAGSGEGRPFELGRYLLGRVPEAELTRIAGDTPAASCEVPYYAGAKAEAEKRMDDASSWYLTAISCLRWREAEYLWAYDSLRRLRDRRQPEED
ncbi:MAG TPA: hypothetical protein VE755_07580, partial [Myxococcales bacterium]|nr:hypothetical protein [Myxococcales bacterium]